MKLHISSQNQELEDKRLDEEIELIAVLLKESSETETDDVA